MPFLNREGQMKKCSLEVRIRQSIFTTRERRRSTARRQFEREIKQSVRRGFLDSFRKPLTEHPIRAAYEDLQVRTTLPASSPKVKLSLFARIASFFRKRFVGEGA